VAIQLGPSLTLAAVVVLAMAALTAVLGVYLLTTNPPKDESKFVGVGAEKMDDEEVEEYHRRMETEREERRRE